MRTFAPTEGPVPRSFSLLFLSALVGCGWYFFRGPGVGQLEKYLPAPKPGYTQSAPPNYTPYPGGPATAQGGVGGQASSNEDLFGGGAPVPVGAPALVGQVASPLAAGPTIRIASFNVQVFGDAKASQAHIMWTLAAIIQNFHVVAIQEIRTQDDYFLTNFLRDYVNQRGRYYHYVIGPRLGRSHSTEQYAYIYDTAAVEINPQSIYTIHDPDDLLHREPHVAMFRARGPPPNEAFTFVLVNTHTDPDETDSELDALGQVYQVVRRTAGGEDDIIILGDLNVDDQNLGQHGKLQGIRPIVRGVFTNTRQSALYDNIILHQASSAEFTGRWGVYNVEQLHSLTRDQALQVSDHLPVWAEFSVYESAGPGRMAAARGAAIRAQ